MLKRRLTLIFKVDVSRRTFVDGRADARHNRQSGHNY
jgi:hypothetical protein